MRSCVNALGHRFCTGKGVFRSQPLRVTGETISEFSKASDDFNPLHLDEEAARGSRFGRRIAHGMIGLTLIQSLMSRHLPDWRLKTLGCKFRAPVFVDDEIIGVLEVPLLVLGLDVVKLSGGELEEQKMGVFWEVGSNRASPLGFKYEVRKCRDETLVMSVEGELQKYE